MTRLEPSENPRFKTITRRATARLAPGRPSPRWSESVRRTVQQIVNRPEAFGAVARVLGSAIRRADLHTAERAFGSLSAKPGQASPGVAATKRRLQQVLLKPVGDACNLACRYCYEAERRRLLPSAVMTEAVLHRILDNILPFVRGQLLLAVHGGEPLLRARPFFEALVRRVGTDAIESRQVILCVQTNGVLVDADWAAFFAENRFEVGLSLDGGREVNDRDRVDHRGDGSFDRVVRALELLREAGLEPGVISVLTAAHAAQEGAATRFFATTRDLGVKRFDVHPSFAPIADSSSFNVSPASYARFMTELFEAWIGEGDPTVEIGSFQHFFQGMNGSPGAACYRDGSCTSIVGVDPSGDVVPCTRPFDATFRFGNLAEEPLPAILVNPSFQRFAELEGRGQQRTDDCPWALLCGRGGCPHERLENGRQAVDGRHVYCTCASEEEGGYPALFAYLRRRIEEELGEMENDATSGAGSE